jgi:hypothetical protein
MNQELRQITTIPSIRKKKRTNKRRGMDDKFASEKSVISSVFKACREARIAK